MGGENDAFPACIFSEPPCLRMEDIRVLFAIVLRVRDDGNREIKSHPLSPLEQFQGRLRNHTIEMVTFLCTFIT